MCNAVYYNKVQYGTVKLGRVHYSTFLGCTVLHNVAQCCNTWQTYYPPIMAGGGYTSPVGVVLVLGHNSGTSAVGIVAKKKGPSQNIS